jgi:hypothetical protein
MFKKPEPTTKVSPKPLRILQMQWLMSRYNTPSSVSEGEKRENGTVPFFTLPVLFIHSW